MKYLSIFFLSFFTATVFSISPHAYVTDGNGTTIEVLDLDADTQQAIFGFDRPRVVKVTSDGTKAFVAQMDGLFVVIDTHTRLIKPIDLGIDHPVALAITPDNRYVYILSGGGYVTVVNLPDYTVETTINGFDNPSDIKIRPDGAFAYVTNTGNGTVSVIRIADNLIVDTITGMHTPLGLTFTNDGGRAYVTDTNRDCIYVINIPTHTLVDKILGFNFPKYIAMCRDDICFYVTSQGNNLVNRVRIADGKLISSIVIPVPSSVALTPDGLHYLVGSSLGAVFKIRVLDDTIVNVFPGIGNPSNIATTVNNPPAITLTGCQVNSNPANLLNHVTWSAASGSPIGYRLYKDASFMHLIHTFSASTTHFDQEHLLEGQTYSYYLIADYNHGYSATFGNINIDPSRVCLGDM